MKNIKKVLAMILVGGSAFALAGCSSGTVYSSTSTSANWNVATSTTVEKNLTEFWRTHKEVANYSIAFTVGGNKSYSVQYYTADTSANYSTAFYMDENDYDWGASSLPDGVKVVGDTPVKDAVYVYETTLTLKGKYIFTATEEEVPFEDNVVTTCKFRLAGESLKPVYSKQEVKSTAASTLTATSKDDMCVSIDTVYETFYNRDCNKATIKTTDNKATEIKTEEKGVDLDGLVFDNSQLSAALRSFNLSGTKSISVCSPQNGNVQGCTVTCGSATALSTKNDAQIINALENVTDGNGNTVEDYIIFDGTSTDPETENKQIRYTPVSIGLSADMKGSSPVYCYATVENADVNTTRSVLLTMSTPLSFGLGTLNYTLKSLSVVNN